MKAFFNRNGIEAGCDEAGRGCLAGPVFAAAVILPKTFRHPYLTDSKLLPEGKRYRLRELIQKKALAYAVAQIDNKEIDQINILNASILGMHKAIAQLSIQPDFLLIDGNQFKAYMNIPHACIVGGDSIYYSIAAASILAKTYRDDYMRALHKEYPEYCWDRNKGYGTLEHRDSLKNIGVPHSIDNLSG